MYFMKFMDVPFGDDSWFYALCSGKEFVSYTMYIFDIYNSSYMVIMLIVATLCKVRICCIIIFHDASFMLYI